MHPHFILWETRTGYNVFGGSHPGVTNPELSRMEGLSVLLLGNQKDQ